MRSPILPEKTEFMQMRVTFTFQAVVTGKTSDKVVSAPDTMNGWEPEEEPMGQYMDGDLADAGVVGGKIRLIASNGQASLEVTYWIPAIPTKKLIARLKKDTIAQLDDGIGESGFEFDAAGKKLRVSAETDEPATVTVVEDGRVILPPSKIAMAARDGEIATLVAAIKDDPNRVETPHQGFSPLQYAVLGGHVEAVRILLAAEADPNQLDSDGHAPLELCALSNAIEDEESCQIAQILLDAGANRTYVNPDGESAKGYAEARGKIRMAGIL